MMMKDDHVWKSLPWDVEGCCVSASVSKSDKDRFRFPFFGELIVSLDLESAISGLTEESFLPFEITSSIIGLRFPVSSLIYKKNKATITICNIA